MLKFSPEMRVDKLIILSLLSLIAFPVAHGKEPSKAVIYIHPGEGEAFVPDYLDNGRMIRRLDKHVLCGCNSIVTYSSASPEVNAAFNRKTQPELRTGAGPDTVLAPEQSVIGTDKPENKCGPAFAAKTNAALLGTTVANLGLEVGFCSRLSLDIPFLYSPYTIKDNYKLKVLAVQPELRYWLDRPFKGHFFGFHTHLGWFNVAVNDHFRYQSRGDSPLWGFGVSYGYTLCFHEHWGAEFTLGAGYAHIPYEKYYNVPRGAQCGSGIKNYWGFTRVGITLVYKFN